MDINITGANSGVNTAGFFYAINGTGNKGVHISGTPAASTNYALYSDAAAQSYFAGNIGIGTTDPGSHKVYMYTDWNSNRVPLLRLHGHGNPQDVAIRLSNRRISYTTGIRYEDDTYRISYHTELATNDRLTINTSGDVAGTHGNYHVSSDERLKKDIVTIPNALDKVLALRGVNFKWKEKEDQSLMMGMIAQEVESVIPEVVHTQDNEMETKAVEYQFVVGVLIEAVKELSAKVEALENA
jgi:hypothetical protein